MYQPIFKLKKDLDCRPRMHFYNGTMIKSTLLAQSRTSNAGKVVKTIRQPPYSLNISEADYVVYRRGEVRAGRLLTVPGQPQEEPREGNQNLSAKTRPPPPFISGGTFAKSIGK